MELINNFILKGFKDDELDWYIILLTFKNKNLVNYQNVAAYINFYKKSEIYEKCALRYGITKY